MKRDLSILFTIMREPLAPSEIARRLGIERQLVHYHLKSLMKDGLVMRQGAGRVVKYLARLDRLIENILPSTSNVVLREKLLRELRYTLEISINKEHRKIVESNEKLRVKAIVATALFHAFRLVDPFYSYHSSVFLKELGALLARLLLALVIDYDNDNKVEFALSAFEDIFDAQIVLIASDNKYILHVKKFMGFDDFDLRVDDIMLSIFEVIFKEMHFGSRISVQKYPEQYLRLHYSYLIKIKRAHT